MVAAAFGPSTARGDSMRFIGLAAAALLSMVACAGKAADTWQEFRMPGADFVVSVPSEPKVEEDVTTKDGYVTRHYVIESGAASYMIAYKTSAAAANTTLDGRLDNTRNALVAGMKGALRDEHRFSLGESRGAEIVVEVPARNGEAAYSIKGRVYVRQLRSDTGKKDVLYQTLALGDLSGDEAATVTRLLDSFRFVGG
jgi:hypothetical protein